MADNTGTVRGLNLLSFDGGGITGLSSLLLLKGVMNRLKLKAGLTKTPDPWEYFDIVAGTGTGAISAVMLGRLRMSVDDAIRAYAELASKVYSNKKTVVSTGLGIFRATKLEECLKAIVEKQTGNPDEQMMEENLGDVKCKVVVYALSAHNMNAGLPCPFRTYPANANAMPDCPIWKALRASTAHPELFKSIEIGELGVGQSFVGGGLGCSNPTALLLKETSALYPGRPVGSVVSIGTGHARTIGMARLTWSERLLPHSIPRVLQVAHELATDNERVAEEMANRFSEAHGVYHRLSVGQGMQSIEPSDWEKQSEVASHTTAYMLQEDTNQLINRLVARIYERPCAVKTHQIDGRAVLSAAPLKATYTACPPPTALFTGRTQEIDTIKSYFENNHTTQKVFVLLGLGGAGKTQVALRSAELMAPRRVHLLEGLLFIDGSSRQNIEAALGVFATSRHLGNTYMDALKWLGTRDMCWLILFDNVDDPDIRLHEYFPSGGGYSILITTRHLEIARLAQGLGACRNISELDPEDAIRLLLKASGLNSNGLPDSERVAATTLLQKLGNLALAISHCGAYICRNRCSIAQYHDIFVAEPQYILGVDRAKGVKVPGHERSIHLTWEISYKQVGILSKRVLGLAAFLHRDQISEVIFRRAFLNLGVYQQAIPPTDAETNAQREVKDILQLFADKKGNWSSRLFLEAMGELVCLSLVTFDTQSHVYQLHPLVQEWTRALAPDTSVAIEQSSFLLALSIDEGGRSEDHAFRRTIIPHVNEVMSLCPTPSSNNAWQFIKAYDEIDSADGYEQLELEVLKARASALGHDHPATLEAMCYIAGTHSHRGALARAAELFSEVLATQQRVLGEDHIDTLATMRGLAGTYHLQDRLAEAEALNIHALAAHKRLLGDDHPDTLLSMSDLAVTYHRMGRLPEAEVLDKVVLAARKRVLGDDHPQTLMGMSNLATGYHNQGRYIDAELLHVETLAAQKRVLGDNHPDTLFSAGGLAAAYHKQGRLSEAEVLEVQTLSARKRVLGCSHPDTIHTMRNLAWTYHAQGHKSKYEELMAEVDAISANQ